MDLEIEGCHGIIKIITHSTAKSLVRLKRMSVVNCREMEEIVGGGDDDEEISFPQLYDLNLGSLLKLGSFCSSCHYTFDFPSSKAVPVNDCPNMKTFSQGALNTPVSRSIRFESDDHWEGNLNSTIQQFLKEQVHI